MTAPGYREPWWEWPYVAWTFVAYWLVLWMPSHGRLERVWFWLLPHAGYWGHRDAVLWNRFNP